MHQRSQGARRRERLAGARLYLVLPSAPADASQADAAGHQERLIALTRAAIAGGVDIVQLREKHADETALRTLAHDLARACEDAGALFIVNDSPQLALDTRADGVHVGQDDMPAGDVRAIVGPDMLIGLSTHAPREIDGASAAAAEQQLVDYIGVGPVHETPTKPGRPAVGSELVAYAAANTQLPFFAIGGLDASNLDEVIAAGAERVVILRAIADAAEPERAARAICAQLGAAASASDASAPAGDSPSASAAPDRADRA